MPSLPTDVQNVPIHNSPEEEATKLSTNRRMIKQASVYTCMGYRLLLKTECYLNRHYNMHEPWRVVQFTTANFVSYEFCLKSKKERKTSEAEAGI